MPKKKFEDAMKRLEMIVDELESGQTDLDESIKLFEEGLGLSKALNEQLKSYENKIAELTNKDEDNA